MTTAPSPQSAMRREHPGSRQPDQPGVPTAWSSAWFPGNVDDTPQESIPFRQSTCAILHYAQTPSKHVRPAYASWMTTPSRWSSGSLPLRPLAHFRPVTRNVDAQAQTNTTRQGNSDHTHRFVERLLAVGQYIQARVLRFASVAGGA